MVSILDSIKKLLGVSAEDKSFDDELILHINGALMVMTQLGVGPKTGYRIVDNTAKWADMIGGRKDLDLVVSDVYLRVRLIFDPPQNSFLVTSIQAMIKEYDWRIEEQHNRQEV